MLPITNELTIQVDPNINAISVMLFVSISKNPDPKKKKCHDNDFMPGVVKITNMTVMINTIASILI